MSCTSGALGACTGLNGSGVASLSSSDALGYKAAAGLVEISEYLAELDNNSFSAKILNAMADSPQARIRELAAGDPETPSKLLGRLAKDQDDSVAKAAIFNPNGPYAETVESLSGAGIGNEELFAITRKQNNTWKNKPRCGSCGCWVSAETMICNRTGCALEGNQVDLDPSWRGREAMGETIDASSVNPYGRLGYLRDGDNATRAALVQMKWDKARGRKLSPAANEVSKGLLAEFVAMKVDDPLLAMGYGGVLQFDPDSGVYLFKSGFDEPLTPIPARSAGEAVRTALRYLEAEGYEFGPIKIPPQMENAVVVGGNDVYVHMSRPEQTGYIAPPPPPPLPEMDLKIPQGAGKVDFKQMLFDATAGTVEFDWPTVASSMEQNVAPLMVDGWRNDSEAMTAIYSAMQDALPDAWKMTGEFAFQNAWNNPGSYESEGASGLSVDSPEFDKAAEYFAQAKTEFTKQDARKKAASTALGAAAMKYCRSFKVGPVTAVYTSEHFRTTAAVSELNAAFDANPALRDEDWVKDVATFTPPTSSTSMRYKVEKPTYSMDGKSVEAVAAEYVDARRQAEMWEARMDTLKGAMSAPVLQQGKSHKAANGLNVVFSQGKKERRSWKPTVLAKKFEADQTLAERFPEIYQTFGDTRVNAYSRVMFSES